MVSFSGDTHAMGGKMMNQNRNKLKYAAAGLAVLLLAAAVLTGAAAADGDSNHSVTIATDVPSGWITTNPQNSANAGATVTITVNPAAAVYLVDGTLKYTPLGEEGTLIQKDTSGKYTFTMPDKDVTISAKFMLTGGAFYYENVQGFSGVYKYLDNVIDLAYSNPKVLEPSLSRPEGQYASTTTTDA